MTMHATDRLRSASLVALTSFVALVVALHFLRLDVDPFRWGLSFYAVGQYSALMTAAFLLLAVTALAVSATVRASGAHSHAGVTLLAIGAAAIALVAAFPSNTVPPATTGDVAHVAASAVFFLCFAVGSQLVSFRHADRRLKRVTVVLSFIYLVSLLMTFFGPEGVHGLLQRTTVFAAAGWLGATALLLPRRIAAQSAAQSDGA